MTICEDAYDARMMGIAVDFLRLVKDGDVLHWEVVTALVGTMCFCFFLYMWWDTELRQAGE